MSTRICQNCGSELTDEARFCPTCGKETTVPLCQYCGTSIPGESQFCPNCGKRIAAQTCHNCGAIIPEGSIFCPDCGKETAADERLNQEAEAARLKLEQEKEAARQAEEAALLAKREAEAVAQEKARQEAEAARLKLEQEKEAARRAEEAALLAKREAEAIAQAPTKKTAIRHPSLGLRVGIGFFAVTAVSVLLWIGLPLIRKGTSDNTVDVVTTTNMTTVTTTTTNLTTATTTNATTVITANATTATTSTSNLTLSEVLDRANSIDSIKYDVQTTRPGSATSNSKIWVKENKCRMESTEQGQTTVLFIDNNAQTVYKYLPEQNTATMVSYPPKQKNVIQEANGLLDVNPEVVGSETVDGKICFVIEFIKDGLPAKAWIWQDYGIPIRIESTGATGVTVVQHINIEFSYTPDIFFELPTGVIIQSR